jgi:hypothetical protein
MPLNQISHRETKYPYGMPSGLLQTVRVILNEIGLFHPGYSFFRYLSIKHRYNLLKGIEPNLLPYKKLFFDIQDMRDSVDHDDSIIPEDKRIRNFIDEVKLLDILVESKIIPSLVKTGKTPQEKFSEEWKAVLAMYDSLCDYSDLSVEDFENITVKIDKFSSISSNLDKVTNEVIHEARVGLCELLNELKIFLEQLELLRQDLISEHNFDVWRGK